MKSLFILLSLTTVIIAQNVTSPSYVNRKFYECPRRFKKIGRKCFFFSKNSATWQDAYYKCRDMKSNIAVITNPNMDKRLRQILSRPTHATEERWLGSMYDWNQMIWVWAASGKPLTYNGFATKNFTEDQRWHCIIVDPKLGYRWNSRPCFERKQYICHTKAKVTIKSVTPPKTIDKNLNEIPLPNVGYQGKPSNLRERPRFTSRQKRRKTKDKKRRKIYNTTILLNRRKYKDLNSKKNVTLNSHHNDTMEMIKYEIYEEDPKHSLYPKPIIEKYSFVNKN